MHALSTNSWCKCQRKQGWKKVGCGTSRSMHLGIRDGQISAIINKWLKFSGCVVYKPRGSSWNPAGSGFNPWCLCVRAAVATCHKHLGGQTRNSEQSRTDRSSYFDLQHQPENAELDIWTRMAIFGTDASFTLPSSASHDWWMISQRTYTEERELVV